MYNGLTWRRDSMVEAAARCRVKYTRHRILGGPSMPSHQRPPDLSETTAMRPTMAALTVWSKYTAPGAAEHQHTHPLDGQ